MSENFILNLSSVEKKIIRFIQRITKQANGVVVGLSGGVDSALVATLCVRALGKDNVVGLIMPERGVTKKNDVHDAQFFAKQLGIKTFVYPIQEIVDALHSNILLHGGARANAKARARMMHLYAFANTHDYLVAGTGNKSELMVGYFTKYGDGAVDFLPIADLYKTDVWKLAQYLGVSQSIIDKVPSAGLWKGQTDEDELGLSYKQLDLVLRKRMNGISAETIMRVKELVKNSNHKRVAVPICKI